MSVIKGKKDGMIPCRKRRYTSSRRAKTSMFASFDSAICFFIIEIGSFVVVQMIRRAGPTQGGMNTVPVC